MPELNPAQRRALEDLQGATETTVDEVRWDRENRAPNFISGKLSQPSAEDPVAIARRFLDATANLVELPEGAHERLDVANITTDPQGFRHVTFQQTLNDVPVFEGSIQVHIDPNGQVISSKANRATAAAESMVPAVSVGQALTMAKSEFGEQESDKVPPTSELVLFRNTEGKPHLTWHVSLFSDQDLATYHFFIDAKDGAVLYKYNDLRHLVRETYTAYQQEILPGSLIIVENNRSYPADAVAWDAHRNAGRVYKYFKRRFLRDSYDGLGAPLRSTVHFSTRYNNAFWTSQMGQMVYGDGDGVQFSPLSGSLDVVGHELTHALTSNTARFIYAEEAGALDESFADFFGVMISNGRAVKNWKMGERVFTPRIPGDALRYVDDPPRGGQPDHVDQQQRLAPGQLPECNPRSPAYNDNGYVHTNSGIPNKVGYLMVAGGTHRGVSVTGLGKDVAERIMYLALTVYLESAGPSRWTFRQARLATVDACRQLFAGDQEKLSSVTNAWTAVGVRA